MGVTACTDAPSRSVAALPQDLPRFTPTLQKRGVARSNVDIAEDFLDLTFRLEGGQKLSSLLKYEKPVRIALRSPGLETYGPELNALMERLRREAGIDVALTRDIEAADIHIQAVPRKTIQRVFPGAACFIVPGVTSWREFRNPISGRETMWSRQTMLDKTAIFIPGDSTPQDTRDCLHEEIGQALGPANDVYRIADTIFNDDNFHSVLTPFDMVILRSLYHPSLRNGMTASEVAARLPDILRETNPAGNQVAPTDRAAESSVWKTNIETALSRRNSQERRLGAARAAISEASRMAPPDHRLGLSLMTYGRILVRNDPMAAGAAFETAYKQYAARFGRDDIHTAHAALHQALLALSLRNYPAARDIATVHMRGARNAENAMVLSGLHAVAAEAQLALGNSARARDERVRSLHWARYAFGDADGDIARAQKQIASFNPNAAGGS